MVGTGEFHPFLSGWDWGSRKYLVLLNTGIWIENTTYSEETPEYKTSPEAPPGVSMPAALECIVLKRGSM